MQAEALEKLKHIWPNTPENQPLPPSDPRFATMWCPFHKTRRVALHVYITDWGEPWFNCNEGCLLIQQRIEALLTKQQPQVTSYVAFDASTIIYEARWSL